MPIKYVEGDLFEHVKKLPLPTIVPHVVNCHGKWGSGFVVPLGRIFPIAKQEYENWCKNVGHRNPLDSLGETQIVEVSNEPLICVANMMAQTLGGSRPLFYNHLCRCMDEVASVALKQKAILVAPAFGAGLGGGDWRIIEKLIEDCWLYRDIEVTVCYLENNKPEGLIPSSQKIN